MSDEGAQAAVIGYGTGWTNLKSLRHQIENLDNSRTYTMDKRDKQSEAQLNSMLVTDELSAVAAGSSSNWQQLPSYEEAASQLEPPDINVAGVRRPPKEQWHLFSSPDHAEAKLTSAAEDHAFEHYKHRITSEGNVVTYAKELHDRSYNMHWDYVHNPQVTRMLRSHQLLYWKHTCGTKL
jgi:wyosine [tRNA(Phe)-imidazoG37] synthetase (radical SAM superfamily)